MENEIKSFLVYNEWISTAEGLPEQDRNDLYRLIMLYGAKKEINEEEFGIVAKSIFSGMIKERIDKAQENYQHSIETGRKGGRPKTINDDEIYDMLVAGWKQKDIAAKFKVSEAAISKSEGKMRYKRDKDEGILDKPEN